MEIKLLPAGGVGGGQCNSIINYYIGSLSNGSPPKNSMEGEIAGEDACLILPSDEDLPPPYDPGVIHPASILPSTTPFYGEGVKTIENDASFSSQ